MSATEEPIKPTKGDGKTEDALEYAFGGVDSMCCGGGDNTAPASQKEDTIDEGCNAVEAATCGSTEDDEPGSSTKAIAQEEEKKEEVSQEDDSLSYFCIVKESEDDKLGIFFRSAPNGKVYLSRVKPEGLCSALHVGDEIVSINGTKVENKEQMSDLIKQAGLKLDIVTRPIAETPEQFQKVEEVKATATKVATPKAESPKKKKKGFFGRSKK